MTTGTSQYGHFRLHETAVTDAVQLGSTEDTLEMWPLKTAGCSAIQFTYRLTEILVQ